MSGEIMRMIITDILTKMIAISHGNLHDIEHFLKVYSYAKIIGQKELKDENAKYVLEIAAIIHDIACPVCRAKYGKTDGNLQELESPALIDDFLAPFNLPQELTDRISWLVSHHHTYSDVQLLEHRILLEADFLVNAAESKYSLAQIESAKQSFFRTRTGISLLNSIFFCEGLKP
jgi:hypothetical protein